MEVLLALFFLYFVLISGGCGDVLNCRLQKFIRETMWFKHFVIYISIVIFTFVLNWYTYNSLAPSITEEPEPGPSAFGSRSSAAL